MDREALAHGDLPLNNSRKSPLVTLFTEQNLKFMLADPILGYMATDCV
jgi:hypothetical protein